MLKVAPPGLEPVRNRDVARQARLMRALDGAPGVRVPSVFFEDDGDPPEVSPFHAMNIVPGECLEPILQPPLARRDAARPRTRVRRGPDARRAAPRRPDRGRPRRGEADTLEAEIKRWTRAFETVDERMNARYLEAEELLFATMPPALPEAVCHGDYRLGNMLCDGGEVAPSSTGRSGRCRIPASTSRGSCSSPPRRSTRWRGNPGRRACRPRRAARRVRRGVRREPANLEWFHCLIRYKEAAATALLMKRAVKSGRRRREGTG